MLNLMPVYHLQQPVIRELYSVMALGNSDCAVPTAHLHPKAIRHMIIEIYSAVRGVIMGFLHVDVKKKAIPSITFTLDKVISKVSGNNFVGIRIFFIDAGGVA